jgi:hypothetical protein
MEEYRVGWYSADIYFTRNLIDEITTKLLFYQLEVEYIQLEKEKLNGVLNNMQVKSYVE